MADVVQRSKIRGTYRENIPTAFSTSDVQNAVFGKTIAAPISSSPIAVFWSLQRGDGSVIDPTVGVGGYPSNPSPGSLYFVLPNLGAVNAGIGKVRFWLFTAIPTEFSNGWVLIYALDNIGNTQGAGGDGGSGGGGGDGGD